MIKKIFLWTVFASFVGLLVFGAVNRTAAKVDHDRDQSLKVERELEKEQSPNSPGNNRLGGNSDNNRQQGNSGNIKQADESREYLTESNPKNHDWMALAGTIDEVDSSRLWIKKDDSVIMEITGRAWRFAQESGYIPAVGNEIELDGFYEDGEYKPAVIRDLTTGQAFLLRDESGHPLWSGGSNKK